MFGLRTTCLYGLEPYQLGFCGPFDNKASSQLIKNYLQGKKCNTVQLKKILKEFVAPYSYYSLIAQKNSIKNPFSKKIAKAYWIGNDLLKKAGGYKSHHTYHVLVIGSVTERIKFNDALRDLCRVSWGCVKRNGHKLLIEYQPLRKKNGKYILARAIEKEIEWNRKITPNIKKGDIVSVHWNQAIEVLKKSEAANLEKYTQQALNNI